MNDARIIAQDRIGGLALMLAAAGTVLAMAHHPSGPHGGPLGGIVHAAMILLLGAMTYGFVRFAQGRGFDRSLVLAGAVAFGASFVAHVGAATINGAVVPAIAARGQPVSHDIFLLAWEANQALARLGVVATGLAYFFWGMDLARDRPTRWIGLVGVVAGLVPAGLLLAGALRMNVTGAFIVYAAHAAWAVVLGAAMVRGVAWTMAGRQGDDAQSAP